MKTPNQCVYYFLNRNSYQQEADSLMSPIGVLFKCLVLEPLTVVLLETRRQIMQMTGETAALAQQLLLWGYHRCHFPKKLACAEAEERHVASHPVCGYMPGHRRLQFHTRDYTELSKSLKVIFVASCKRYQVK